MDRVETFFFMTFFYRPRVLPERTRDTWIWNAISHYA